MKKVSQIIITGLLAGVFITLAYIGYLYTNMKSNEEASNKIVPPSEYSAEQNVKALNYLKAAGQYSASAIDTDDPDQKLYLNLNEGISLIKGEEYEKGIIVLSNIYKDIKVPAELRADALMSALDAYIASRNVETLNLISKYFDLSFTNNGDESDLYFKQRVVLETAIEIFPISYSYYRLAVLNASQAYFTAPQKDFSIFTEEANENIIKGNQLARIEAVGIEDYWSNPIPYNYGKEYWFVGQASKLITKIYLYKVNPSEELYTEVENLYLDMQPYFEGDRTHSRWLLQLFVRMYYGSFLIDSQPGDYEKLDKTIRLLLVNEGNIKPINEKALWPTLRMIANSDNDQDLTKVIIFQIADAHEGFRKLVETF